MSSKSADAHSAYERLISSIETFFDYARPAQHQKTVRSMLRAVQQNDFWKKRDPASLLEFMEVLQQLITAVDHFEKSRNKDKNDSNPTHMGVDETILNGFQSFFKFQRYKKWQKQLNLILHFALSTNSNISLGAEIDLLGTYIQLNSLIGHCHHLFMDNSGKNKATP